MSRLHTFLEQIIGSQSKEQMACIIETTHGLLIAHLLEAGWPVYPVNPRTVDRRRSASGAKTDAIDAYLLAKTGRADLADLHRLIPDSEKVSELKELTRDQDGLIRMQTRLVNQLTACLKAYYFGRTTPGGTQTSQAPPCEAGRCPDFRAAAPAALAG
jgi:transposase